MAKIYGNDKGDLIRILVTQREEEMFPIAPEDSVSSLELDQYENKDLLNDVAANQKNYSLIDGVLHKEGTPIPIAGDGEKFQEEKSFVLLKESFLAGNAVTNQDLTTLLRYVFTKLGI